MNLMYELVTFLIICLIVLPILIGVGISLLLGLTGVPFYSVVIGFTLVIWVMVYLFFYY